MKATSKPTLAVDFDSVLANTTEVAFNLLEGCDHNYSLDDVESWTWGFDEFGQKAYLNALWHAWTIRPLEVPAMEDHIAQKMAALHRDYEVHIVTAHPEGRGIEDGKLEWLDEHSIGFEEFHVVPNEVTKADYGYDAYVDDKPALPANAHDYQTVYVRDQPWNRDINGDYIRVDSIADVLNKDIAIY
jgi:5'(3')-deoxyribonucleotidase